MLLVKPIGAAFSIQAGLFHQAKPAQFGATRQQGWARGGTFKPLFRAVALPSHFSLHRSFEMALTIDFLDYFFDFALTVIVVSFFYFPFLKLFYLVLKL